MAIQIENGFIRMGQSNDNRRVSLDTLLLWLKQKRHHMQVRKSDCVQQDTDPQRGERRMTKQAQENEKAYLSSLTSVYLAMLASVYLLYPGLGGYQEIVTQKWETYLILSGTYIVAMGIFKLDLTLARVRGVVSLKREGRPMGPSQRLVIGYLLATSLSTFLSQYWSTAIWGSGRREGLITITLYCISFFLVSRYVHPKRWMLWLFAVTISANCIVALLQFAGYNPFYLYPDGMDYYDGNMLYSGSFLGMVGYVDILSALLSLAIPAFFAALLRWKDSRRRYLLIVPMALCTFVLLQAFVAGGILGVSGAVLLSVPVLLESKTMRRRARFIVVAAILLLAAGVYCFGEHMGGFFYEASELMHGRWDDRFGSGRLYIWRSVLPLVKERPLFGGGPDTLGLRTTAAFDGSELSN